MKKEKGKYRDLLQVQIAGETREAQIIEKEENPTEQGGEIGRSSSSKRVRAKRGTTSKRPRGGNELWTGGEHDNLYAAKRGGRNLALTKPKRRGNGAILGKRRRQNCIRAAKITTSEGVCHKSLRRLQRGEER